YHAARYLFPAPEACARARKVLTGCASAVFIASFGIECVVYLVSHVIVNLVFAWHLVRTRDEEEGAPGIPTRRMLYTLLLMFHIGQLVICKTVIRAVPVGMSFYTFTQIAFVTDVYRGEIKAFTPADYLIHTVFFPKFLQGPIMRFAETREMVTGGRLSHAVPAQAVWSGATLFSLGLAKKVLVADTLGGMLDTAYSLIPHLTRPDAVLTILLFPAQLYFDFSGYCDMGMGIARMMGLDLPVNFRTPLRATNIVQYWKQWHMTLTAFFTRYLYIPLGGSRRGQARTYRNMLIVFLVSGFWHGAGITFLIWGALHGICYVLTDAWRRKKGGAVSVAFTYVLVSVIYVFFRAPRVSDALKLFERTYGALVGYVSDTVAKTFYMDEIWYLVKMTPFADWKYSGYICMAVFLAVLFVLLFFVPCARDLTDRVADLAANGSGKGVFVKCACFTLSCAVLFVWALVSTGGVGTYLYVNF
ncbi:MAG: MBOAT family protein, partial [Butyrivibrio sp.]|nr:MBOAT family protein [Butyrivibrio sp.]